MMMPTLVITTGTIAGFCTTVAYVPQAVKTWRQGGRDLSYGMLILYLTGVVLWLIYGLLIQAQAVIITNVATAILIAIIMGLKVWREKAAPAQRSVPGEAIGRG